MLLLSSEFVLAGDFGLVGDNFVVSFSVALPSSATLLSELAVFLGDFDFSKALLSSFAAEGFLGDPLVSDFLGLSLVDSLKKSSIP